MLEAAESVPVRQATVEAPESRPAARVVRVTGTVRVGDVTPKDVALQLWDVGPDHAVVELRGTGTRLEGDVPAGPCRVGRIVADGHDHDELTGDALEVEEGKPIQLELEALDLVPFVVRDAMSGKTIPGARIHRLRRGYSRFGDTPVLPPFDFLEGPEIVADAGGRAEMPRKAGRFRDDSVYVEAGGWAWKQVEIPKRVSAEGIEVGLQKAGSVAIGVSGTSYSAAFVSGLAGLLLSQNPSLTPAEVKQLIEQSGTRVPKLDVASGRIADAAGSLAAAG